ncbi:hypothetical protein BDZ97DRAFT_1763440 [Flammula alnicola]|nr:hypothetical protein BDZ97DRAFT_1763440 [Flammula alnicola]
MPVATKTKGARINKSPHSECRPVECHICGKFISRKSDLNRHVATHNPNAERYPCTLCNYSTLQKCNLKAHEKAKHQDLTAVDQQAFKATAQKRTKRKRDSVDSDSVVSASSSNIVVVEATASTPRRIPLRVVRTIESTSRSPSQDLEQFSIFSATPPLTSDTVDSNQGSSNATTPLSFHQDETVQLQSIEPVDFFQYPDFWTSDTVDGDGDHSSWNSSSASAYIPTSPPPCAAIPVNKLAECGLHQRFPIRLYPGNGATGNLEARRALAAGLPPAENVAVPLFPGYASSDVQGYPPTTAYVQPPQYQGYSSQEFMQIPQESVLNTSDSFGMTFGSYSLSSSLAFSNEYENTHIALDSIDVWAFHFAHELPLADIQAQSCTSEGSSVYEIPEEQFDGYELSSLLWDGKIAAYAGTLSDLTLRSLPSRQPPLNSSKRSSNHGH